MLSRPKCGRRFFGRFWNKTWYRRVNRDLDSSAKSAYGHQEGVAGGHNTERSHKPMLNPLFAFIAQTGECLNVWLRPGNTASANGGVEFLKECLALVPKQVWSVVAENLIGAGKNQPAFGSMPVHKFWADHALLQVSVFAYNLMIWFQRMTLDAHRRRERPNTLRVGSYTWLLDSCIQTTRGSSL